MNEYRSRVRQAKQQLDKAAAIYRETQAALPDARLAADNAMADYQAAVTSYAQAVESTFNGHPTLLT